MLEDAIVFGSQVELVFLVDKLNPIMSNRFTNFLAYYPLCLLLNFYLTTGKDYEEISLG